MDSRIRKAYDIIKKRYQDKLLLNQLGNEVCLSQYHFHGLFKKEMGETPTECVTRIRLDRATHLIGINPKRSLTTIASDCGFSSLSSFSRSFVKQFGISPTKWSKNLQLKRDYPLAQIAAKNVSFKHPEIVHFPGCWILYQHTSVFIGNLIDTFQSVITFCQHEGIQTNNDRMCGIFTHIHLAFDGPKNHLNYYAGVEILIKPKVKYHDRIYWIPGGKYAVFSSRDSYFDMLLMHLKFKIDFMDGMGLNILEPFSFEQIDVKNDRTDYPYLERTIYIPVKK